MIFKYYEELEGLF